VTDQGSMGGNPGPIGGVAGKSRAPALYDAIYLACGERKRKRVDTDSRGPAINAKSLLRV